MRIHAMGMLSLGPEETPGHQGCDACRWLSRCLGDERRYRPIPFSRQLLVGRAGRRYLYQEPGVSERASWLSDVPIFFHATSTTHPIKLGRHSTSSLLATHT